MDNRGSWTSWEGAGGGDVPPRLCSLCRMLPERLSVLYDPVRLRYCYRKVMLTEDCGLLAFSEAKFAKAYALAHLRGSGYRQIWRIPLDHACALARERSAPINSVILYDNYDPVIHYVR